MKKLKAINNNLFQFVEEEKEQPTCKLFVKFIDGHRNQHSKTYYFNDVKQAKKAFKMFLASSKIFVTEMWLLQEKEEIENLYWYIDSVFPKKDHSIWFKKESHGKILKSHFIIFGI